MAEKTYNTGRVVGWSAYEEFIRETGTDPGVISSYIYQTLTTYGVSRRVELAANGWEETGGGQFYMQTIEVAGASWGAVPVIGIDYESYMDFFTNPSSTTTAERTAEINDTFEKETLEQTVGNIFSVYVSDSHGNKATNSLSDHGYLTFVAYPDVVDFMQGMPGEKLKLIVRGLSMENLGDVNNLYYGPQGLMFAGNGMVADCTHSTENMNRLSLNSAGVLWMSVGGASSPADTRGLVNHPEGTILTSTFGYLDQNMLGGTGSFVGSTYALSYKEYVDGLGDIECFRSQVEAIPELERDNYVYLVDGMPSYTDYPAREHPFNILPVRKDTGRVNIGYLTAFSTPKMKKLIDFTRTYGSDDTSVLYLYNKKLPEYIGNWWTISPMGSTFTEGLVYVGSGPLNTTSYWLGDDLTESGTFHRTNRQASWKLTAGTYHKGAVYVIYNQIDPLSNGLYLCTADSAHENLGYSLFNRIGGYISGSRPQWIESLDVGAIYQMDLSSHTTAITNSVLYVDGCPIYPGEALAVGNVGEQYVLYVENTISSATPKLIVRNIANVRPEVDVYVGHSSSVADVSDTHSNIITIGRSDWDAGYAGRELTVNTSATTTETFTVTNTDVTPGTYVKFRHSQTDVYGRGKSYTYVVLGIDSDIVRLASAMVFIDNPDLLTTVGAVGQQDSIIPRYNQQLPNSMGTYYYNVGAALNKITAKQFFEDFGWNIADYVDADFQDMSLGELLRECVIRNDLSIPKSPDTNRGNGMNVTYYLYTKEELGITPLAQPDPSDPGREYCRMPQPNPEINHSLTLNAKTKPTSFFDTAFFTATDNNGTVLDINNPDYPIWVTLGKSRFGPQVMSESLIDKSGTRLDFSGNAGTIEADKINWLDLLIALGTGKSLDILKGMVVHNTTGGQTCLVGADGTKLIISSTAPDPTNLDVGTIGIGW